MSKIRGRAVPNPPKRRRARPARECQRAMREAQDVAADANEKIEAIARAHYAKCEACKQRAAETQIRNLQYQARESVDDCGGIF